MTASSTTEIIDGIYNVFAGTINDTREFWFFIGGIFATLFILGLIAGALFFLFKTIFK